ncbi:MAG TPA: phosphatase PAP2 family protein [Gemmatimonadaceae bacterium]|nr:phosphatase PAP2 family protein [Gemmatimonadaceae bacterium]
MRAIWAGKLLVVYLTVTGALLLLGHARVAAFDIAVHFAVLTFIAATVAVTALPATLRLWAPLLVLLFLYAEIPRLIQAAGHTGQYDDAVMGWELAVFHAQPALRWAAVWPSRALSELLHASYLSYYVIIVAVPLALYLTGRRAEFDEAMFVLMLTFVVCFTGYVVFPVSGPRYLWPSPAGTTAGPFRATAIWLLEARSSRGTAFPSSHVAVSVTQSILAVRYFGARGLPILIATIGLALGAIYGGFHYAIDVVAGLVVGMAVCTVGLRMTAMLRARPQANANAPT